MVLDDAARSIDPDPWRRGLREAMARSDLDEQVSLIRRARLMFFAGWAARWPRRRAQGQRVS